MTAGQRPAADAISPVAERRSIHRMGTSRLRRLAAPAAASLVALAILVSLGIWQLERKVWKEDLLARIEARAHGPAQAPLPESAWPQWDPASDEYRRITLEGDFEPDKTVAILGLAELRKSQAVQGYYLFVPLRRRDGSTIIVNRGFVPAELKAKTEAALAAEPRQARIVGLVRAPETRGWFVPANDPTRDTWFVRNVQDIVQARQLERTAPFYVDAVAGSDPEAWPRGGQTQLTLRNNHLGYAITWFGLAATLIGVFAAFAVSRPRDSETTPDNETTPFGSPTAPFSPTRDETRRARPSSGS